MGAVQADLARGREPLVEFQVAASGQLLSAEAGQIAARQPDCRDPRLRQVDRLVKPTALKPYRTEQLGGF